MTQVAQVSKVAKTWRKWRKRSNMMRSGESDTSGARSASEESGGGVKGDG